MPHSFQMSINHLLASAKSLAESTSSPLKEILGDYLTTDIANEWVYSHFAYFLNQLPPCSTKKKISHIVKSICDNFSNATKDETKDLWKLDALNTHSFWQTQRELAKELIIELQCLEACH